MSEIKTNLNKSKKIDRETLNDLMIDSLRHSFSNKAQNSEETIINLSALMVLWKKINEYEESNTTPQTSSDKKEEFKKLIEETKTIFLGQPDDKA